jgi:hypothetical protein
MGHEDDEGTATPAGEVQLTLPSGLQGRLCKYHQSTACNAILNHAVHARRLRTCIYVQAA